MNLLRPGQKTTVGVGRGAIEPVVSKHGKIKKVNGTIVVYIAGQKRMIRVAADRRGLDIDITPHSSGVNSASVAGNMIGVRRHSVSHGISQSE